MACKLDTSIAIARIAGLHGEWWDYQVAEEDRFLHTPWYSQTVSNALYVFAIFEPGGLADSSSRIQTAAGLGAFVLQDDFYELDDETWWKRQLACSQRLRVQTPAGVRYVLPSAHYFAGQSRRVSVKVTLNFIGGTPIDGSRTMVFFFGGTGDPTHTPKQHWAIDEGAHLLPHEAYPYLWLSDRKEPWGLPQDNWYIYLDTKMTPLDPGEQGVWKGPAIECLPDGPYVYESGDWPDSGGMVEGGDASSHDEKEKDPEGPCPTCPDEPQMFIAPGVTCEDPPGGQCPAMWETWYRDPEYVTCHWDDRNFGTWRSNEDGLHQDEETGVWTFYLECFVCGFGAMYEGIIPNAPCPVGMFQKVSGSAEMPASVMIA